MRPDFNKLLVESERVGHRKHFGEHRHLKAFNQKDEDGDLLGGRESMTKRHKANWNDKHFNENLSPLKGWLKSVVGKKWDKSYSELRKTFDARSTINDHILQHLYQFVETHAVLRDGKVMVLKKYSEGGYEPISQGYSDYYVCPKDGTLKITNKISYKSQQRAKAIENKIAKAKIFRIIDKDNHLHLIDGVWYHFTLKDMPPVKFEYVCPTRDGFVTFPYYAKIKSKPWDDMSQPERERYGIRKDLLPPVFDTLSGTRIYADSFLSNRCGVRYYLPGQDPHHKAKIGARYHDTKQTASHKTLKLAGIVNT